MNDRTVSGGKTRTTIHRGYYVIVGLMLLMVAQCFPMNAASIFYTPVSAELGIPVSRFGIHMTILNISVATSVPLLAALFRRMDARYILAGCVIIESLMFLMNSAAHSVYVFYGTSAVLGISLAAYLNLAIPLLVNRWFLVRNSTMIGLCGAAQGIAGMVFNALGGIIIDARGWRFCYLVWAAAALAAGLPAALLLIRDHPQKCGLEPVGAERREAEKDMTAFSPVSNPLNAVSTKKLQRTAAYLVLLIFIGLLPFAYSYNFFMNSYLQASGLTGVMAGFASTMTLFGVLVGKLLIGWLGDRNTRMALLAGVIPSIIAIPVLTIASASGYVLVLAMTFLFGISYSMLNVLGPTMCREKFGTMHFADLWPPATMVISYVAAVGSTLWGFIIDGTGYHPAMWIVTGLEVLGLLTGLVFLRMKVAVK